MQGKKTFIFYCDWINIIREMPNEDAGELIKHILSYVNDEDPKTDNVLVKVAFGHMKPLIKEDLKKWKDLREKRAIAGKRGGKKSKPKQTEANLSKPKQLEPVNVNVNVNENVNDNVNVISYEIKEIARVFKKVFGFKPDDTIGSRSLFRKLQSQGAGDAMQNLEVLLEASKLDDFWNGKITKVSTLDKNYNKIINDLKEKSSKEVYSGKYSKAARESS